ncbi:MAG: SpoIID/LytB domain-containing protein [candidate division WOR-3 bacterium]|mgnify:CR=1 FL=1
MKKLLFLVFFISCQQPFIFRKKPILIDTTGTVLNVEPIVRVKIAQADSFNLEFSDSFYIIKQDTILKGFKGSLLLKFFEGKSAKLKYYKILGRYNNVPDAILEIASLSKSKLNFEIKTIGIKLSNVDTREFLLLEGPYEKIDSFIEGKILALLDKRQIGKIFIKYNNFEKVLEIPFEIHSKSPITIKNFLLDDGLNPPTITTRSYEGYFEVWTDINGNQVLIINVINFENYIKGILPYEMSNNFPLEALRAQAILARSHALSVYRKKLMLLYQPYDLTSDVYTQVYGGTKDVNDNVKLAVDLTRGLFLTFNNNIVYALFHSSCGGILDDGNLWNKPLDYYFSRLDNDENKFLDLTNDSLVKKFVDNDKLNVYCNNKSFIGAKEAFRWKQVFKISELEKKLNRKIVGFEVLERTKAGRIKSLKIKFEDGDSVINGELNIRKFFYKNGYLRSALFYYEIKGDSLIIKGAGFGHGIGLCQYGAGERALKGQYYYQIINAYLNGVEIKRLY